MCSSSKGQAKKNLWYLSKARKLRKQSCLEKVEFNLFKTIEKKIILECVLWKLILIIVM